MKDNGKVNINEFMDDVASSMLKHFFELPRKDAEVRFWIEQVEDRVDYIYEVLRGGFEHMTSMTLGELASSPDVSESERPEVPGGFENVLLSDYIKVPKKKDVIDRILGLLSDIGLDEFKLDKSFDVRVLH